MLMVPFSFANSPQLTIEIKVPSLRMSLDDLDSMLATSRSLIRGANSNIDRTYINESIELTHKRLSVRYESWENLNDESGIPKFVTTVNYNYSSKRGSPVENTSIILKGSYREVEVRGTDKAQVQALATFLETELNKHSNILTSDLVKLCGAIFLILSGAILVTYRRNVSPIAITMNLVGVFVLLSPTVLPWSHWLPGVAVLADSSSYLEQYVNEITLFSTIVTVTSLIFAALQFNKTSPPIRPDDAADL